jgi:hypothetical protein
VRATTTDNSPQFTLDTIADPVPVPVICPDRGHRCRGVNHTYEQRHGRPREQIVGHHVRELLGDATCEAIRPRIERALPAAGRTTLLCVEDNAASLGLTAALRTEIQAYRSSTRTPQVGNARIGISNNHNARVA